MGRRRRWRRRWPRPRATELRAHHRRRAPAHLRPRAPRAERRGRASSAGSRWPCCCCSRSRPTAVVRRLFRPLDDIDAGATRFGAGDFASPSSRRAATSSATWPSASTPWRADLPRHARRQARAAAGDQPRTAQRRSRARAQRRAASRRGRAPRRAAARPGDDARPHHRPAGERAPRRAATPRCSPRPCTSRRSCARWSTSSSPACR